MIAWEARQQPLAADAAVELTGLRRLHELTTKLISARTSEQALDAILDGAVSVHSADFADLQLYRPKTRSLEMVRHKGFDKDFLETFAAVSADDPCACGRALQTKMPIVIHDIEHDPEFKPYLAAARNAGYRAVQSTPILDGEGEVVDIVSTHFRQTRTPSAMETRVLGLYARQAAEILARLRQEEEQRAVQGLVAQELSHRLKNVLTIVQALARQTLKNGSELEAHAAAFEQRLAALARAHSVLAQGQWDTAPVSDIVAQQTVAGGDPRIELLGPDLIIGSEAAYVLGLVLHELGANARKYGALSADTGRVSITWSRNKSATGVRLTWVESGGPAVAPPTASGFGTVLIDNLVRAGLLKVDIDYARSGVTCRIVLPHSLV